MPKVIRRFIDAQVTEIRVVFGVGGIGLQIFYIEQETDEAGNVVRPETEARETVAHEDMAASDRAHIERIARKMVDDFRARKYR